MGLSTLYITSEAIFLCRGLSSSAVPLSFHVVHLADCYEPQQLLFTTTGCFSLLLYENSLHFLL